MSTIMAMRCRVLESIVKRDAGLPLRVVDGLPCSQITHSWAPLWLEVTAAVLPLD